MSNQRELLHKDGSPMREYESKIIEELMNKQQTAVEWLIEQMICQMGIRIENTTIGCELFDQAKAMHKEEILNAHIHGHNAPSSTIKKYDAEQYYNQTYEQTTDSR